MSNQGKRRLGIMVSAGPGERNFGHALGLAEAALAAETDVYLYCIDAAVEGLKDGRFAKLQTKGLKVFACAFSLQRRNLPLECGATLSGLTILNDLLTATDRFVSFN